MSESRKSLIQLLRLSYTDHDPDGGYELYCAYENGMLIIYFEGKLIRPCPPETIGELEYCLKQLHEQKVLLDATAVEFISSSLLGQMLCIYQACEASESAFVMVADNRRVCEQLTALGLDQFFNVVPTRDQGEVHLDGQTGELPF